MGGFLEHLIVRELRLFVMDNECVFAETVSKYGYVCFMLSVTEGRTQIV